MEPAPNQETAEAVLTRKCKNLLAIAQKAKIARDEALEERVKLLNEIEAAKTEIKTKDRQFKTCEEMLAALTEQKLKLSMDMDSLKKEKSALVNQMSDLVREKEMNEIQSENLKQQNTNLIRKSEGLNNELQIKGKSESQLLNDIKKLHENNESVKLLCSGLSDEKMALEKEIETIRLQLKKLSDERNVLNKALSSKLGSDQVDLNSFVEFIANSSSAVDNSDLTSELKKDNESLQTEVDSLKEKIQRLMSDLETANVDRDQMMNNLEEVRVETKTLIENVEKLNEEVESVKLEKDKSEDSLNKIIESKNVEIERLLNEISNGKAYIDELLVSVQEQNDTSSQQLELNRELVQCKNDNENMIQELAELNVQKEHEYGITKSFLSKIKDTVVSAGDLNVLKSNNFNSLVDNLTKILNDQADDNLEARTDNVVNCLSECLTCLFESQAEIDRLNASIEKLENSVESCNKNCEQMKFDLEELSSDNKTLLLDLMALRQENALRVSELDEFMNRLKQRDKTIDDLKEINNCLEAKNEETVAELMSKLSDSNNNFVEEQNKNLKLQSELDIVKEELKSGESELRTVRDELVHINSEYALLKEDFNKSQLEGSMMNQDALKLLTEENEGLKRDIMVIEGTCESYSLENKSLAEKLEELNQSLTSTSEELAQAKASLLGMESLKNQLEESNKKLFNNESLLKTTQELTKEGENYKITLEQMKENFEAKCLELENVNKELSRLSDANNKLEQAKSTMGSRNDELEAELSDMSKNLKTTEEDRLKLQESEAKLTESVECLECENEHLRGQLAQQKQDLSDQLEEKMEEIRQLEKELEEAKEMANFKNLELEEINRVWAGRFNTLKVNLVSLRRSLADLGRQVRELRSLFFDTIHSLNDVVTLKAEDVMDRSVTEAKTELFDEMRRMNEVLKERGESISKLQGLLTETESKFEAVIIHNRDVIEEQTKLKAQLKAKDEQLLTNENLIKELECEVGKLRELKDSAPESDALSTSTISRAEDSMRLRDVDDSIEEKYNKLKLIAVKLKKKSAELTQTLEQERSKFAVEKTELADKIQHLSSAAKNAHALQDSYDKMLDELEETKKQNRINSTAMKELKENEEAMKKRMVSLESCNANIPLMHKQSESLHSTVKDLKSELNKLEMEKKVEVMKYEETKKQCVSLEAKIEQLTQSLDQAIQQSRTNNVLELEMGNYKKIVSDITGQLNAEKQKLAASEKECVSIKTVKNGLEEQISLFEKQVKAEESRNANLQEQVAAMREKSNATQKQVDELNAQLGDLKRELQTGKSQNEQQSLEMSALTSEFSRKEIELHDKVECFSSHIQSLETSLASMRQELSTSNSEKEHLREEFESYKLRAQSTLAKQKSDSVSQGEKEAREQLEKLKKELDGARQKMENNQTEIETLNSKLSSLQLEKARSDKRHEDMTKVLQQKITDFDTLNTEHRAFKISSENLLQNSKLNFEERETRLKEEIKTLKDLVSALNEKIELEAQEREQELVGIKMGSSSNGNNATLFDSHHPIDNLSSLQEREDGEGSESVPPLNNYRRLSNLVPLDILLNNPIDDENRIPVLQSQIEKLHSELNSYEVRVKHIASLLSEAEKDAARSSQQNTVLKEELRRLERSLQREPHIANSEYLKNVIFKFLILQSGDERTRLVPVLDTILKLSKDEAGRLMAIAKGESTSTWGSYLHSWTGL